MTEGNYISEEKYTDLLSYLPLVSMDFIIKNNSGKVLLGLRTNAPASNYWFVPGGRIRRMESFQDACERITIMELGIKINIKDIEFIGAFQHMYPDSSFSKKVGVHYISLGMKMNDLGINIDQLPDAQHKKYQWFGLDEIGDSKNVHERTKDFFDRAIGIRD